MKHNQDYYMMTSKRPNGYCVFILLITVFLFERCGDKNNSRTWSIYKADAESSSYSPLKEINKKNVDQLKIAWIFSANDTLKKSGRSSSECNPIIIDGIMYATSARHRVYAINANNGQRIWSFDPFNGGAGGGINRGVTYWQEGDDKRILFTGGDDLFALDAITGRLISSFGNAGKVSMNVGIRDDPNVISVKPTSPGIVYKDLLIIGNEVSELYGAQPGYIRAYNIRTGELVWTFHTIPKPGETGYDTWPKDAWKYAGGANDWSGMSLDEKREMVFLATGSPSYDFYGADRKGKNLFGNCVVALNAKTGKLIWYFQTIHHDLWDYDLPAPPNLVTINNDGKQIDAVAQTSKVGFVYLLDRETGKPLFPVEERNVPASDVPGEEAWPTQPFPLKPAPYSLQHMTADDLSDFTANHDSLLKRFNAFRYEGLFTPPSTRGTLNLPGTIGGSEWGGAAFDPSTGMLYVKSNDAPEIDLLQKAVPAKSSVNLSSYDEGKKIYMTYCVSCHRQNREGDEPLYPSLVDVQMKLSREEVLNKIRHGGGKMPAFAGVLQGEEDAIVDFLFDTKNKKLSAEEAALLEIKNNISSHKSTTGSDVKNDTAINYLNLTAYAQFEDAEGQPAIKPPWGMLNAINLNTGEYAWKVPFGNDTSLQKKGEGITGLWSSPGPMVTAGGLVFLCGAKDKKLCAFDKATGKILWQTTLPGVGSSTPCTYMSGGKQYVALSVGGDKKNAGGYIIAFALPR